MDIKTEVQALYDLAEITLLGWLEQESPEDRRRQKALELVVEAGICLNAACKNLEISDFQRFDDEIAE